MIRTRARTALALLFAAGIWTALNQIPGPKEPLPMIESEHNNYTPRKELDWDARSKEVLAILLNGGEFKPKELK